MLAATTAPAQMTYGPRQGAEPTIAANPRWELWWKTHRIQFIEPRLQHHKSQADDARLGLLADERSCAILLGEQGCLKKEIDYIARIVGLGLLPKLNELGIHELKDKLLKVAQSSDRTPVNIRAAAIISLGLANDPAMSDTFAELAVAQWSQGLTYESAHTALGKTKQFAYAKSQIVDRHHPTTCRTRRHLGIFVMPADS